MASDATANITSQSWSHLDCPNPSTTPLPRIEYKPILASFLRLCGSLVKLTVHLSDEESIEVLIKSIIEKSTTGKTVFELLKHNIVIFLIFLIGILIGIIVLIGCVVMCLCRWFSGNREKPKSSHIWCAWIMFMLCGAMSIVCIVLVGSGAISITIGLDELPDRAKKSAANVESYVNQLEEQFKCQFEHEINNISDYIEMAAKDIRQDADKLEIALRDFERIQGNLQKDDLEQKLIRLIHTKNVDSTKVTDLIKLIQNTTDPKPEKFDRKQLKNGLSEFKKAVTAFGSQRQAIKTTFHEMVNDTFSLVFHNIAEFTTGLSRSINTFMERHDKFASHTYYIFYLCIIIPGLLLLLCILSMLFLLIRGLFNFCVKDPDSGKRGLLSRFGGEIMGATGYVAMLTTALLFIMSSFAFLTAFAAMVVCVGFFEDRDLRVFRVTDELFMPENTLKIRVSEIFYKCKNNYSFFDAVDGPKLLADNTVEDKVNRLVIRDAARAVERSVDDFDVPSAFDTFMTRSSALFREATSGVDHTRKNDAEASLKAYQAKVKVIADIQGKMSAIIKQFASRAFKEKVNKINHKLSNTVEGLVSYAIDMSPRCDEIMSIWNDIGWYVCYLIAQPLSGIWVACLITAIASLIIYQAIFDATKYLKSVDASTSKTLE